MLPNVSWDKNKGNDFGADFHFGHKKTLEKKPNIPLELTDEMIMLFFFICQINECPRDTDTCFHIERF